MKGGGREGKIKSDVEGFTLDYRRYPSNPTSFPYLIKYEWSLILKKIIWLVNNPISCYIF